MKVATIPFQADMGYCMLKKELYIWKGVGGERKRIRVKAKGGKSKYKTDDFLILAKKKKVTFYLLQLVLSF